jgi:hypothetical protein
VCTTVAAAGRAAGASWPTAMEAARVQAEAVLDEEPTGVEALGIDEGPSGRPRWRPAEPVGTTKRNSPARSGTLAECRAGCRVLGWGLGRAGECRGLARGSTGLTFPGCVEVGGIRGGSGVSGKVRLGAVGVGIGVLLTPFGW